MAKYSGYVGFAVVEETEMGVWTQSISERLCYGDVLRRRLNVQQNTSINGDITLSNEISIVADPYANENFHCIRFVTYMGKRWCVTGVEVEYPRIRLTLGGVFNG